MFEGVMEGGFRAIIKDTIMMVNKKIRNASIRGRRTALHISKTMMQVNGHGSQVIAVQLRTSVTTRGHQRFQQQSRVAVAQQVMRFKQQT